MKTKNIVLSGMLLSSLLFACSKPEQKEYLYFGMSSKEFFTAKDDIRPDTSKTVEPFNSFVRSNIYYTLGEYTNQELGNLEKQFQEDILYYHALSDRHYDYYDYRTNSEGELIHNVKFLNDSYGSETAVVVDPFLYDLLKESYTFTIHSNGRFNMFLGTLNDLYENHLDAIKADGNQRGDDAENQQKSGFIFSSFTQGERAQINVAEKGIPTTKEEISSLLEFNDQNHSVIFHALNKDGKKVDKLEISLGGNAKGFATQRIAEAFVQKYPNISMIIDSGNSSIKAIGNRPDGSPWNILYSNPPIWEYYGKDNPFNRNEISLSVDGPFNLSTSGTYLQYFYDSSSGEIQRQSHIINPFTGYSTSFFDQASVFLEDTGLADMYTTALLTCDSLKEATDLFSSLNQAYPEESQNAELVLCFKADPTTKEKVSLTKENLSSFASSFEESCYVSSNLFSSFHYVDDQNGNKRVSQLYSLSI